MPPEKRTRVILSTDAKNEADDQFAIVHALLTPSFELHGLVPAHFGTAKSPTSLQDSHDEVMLLLRLMDLEGRVMLCGQDRLVKWEVTGYTTLDDRQLSPQGSQAPVRAGRSALGAARPRREDRAHPCAPRGGNRDRQHGACLVSGCIR